MKVRIIKTSKGYIAQAFFDPFFRGEDHWYSLGGGDYWSEASYIYEAATYRFKFMAQEELRKFKKKVTESQKIKAFKKELENPNVVYEAEV